MTGNHDAIGLLREAQAALHKADQLIDKICQTGESGVVLGLIAPAVRLKKCLAEQIVELERWVLPRVESDEDQRSVLWPVKRDPGV